MRSGRALGTVLVAPIGVAIFEESMPAIKLLSISLIIAGVIELNLVVRSA